MILKIKIVFLLLLFSKLVIAQNAKPNLVKKDPLYDKILGCLVGSAIGDAMGAPTEMWGRADIQKSYGFVDRLDSVVREPSPEGVWIANLPAGGTTDDTRWKKLMVNYLISEKSNNNLIPENFAKYILSEFEKYKNIENNESQSKTEPNLQSNWLVEWAKVARPYIKGNYKQYSVAVDKFYGGEMVCGGMLYAPIAGAFFPNNPLKAYQETYKISIFDIGYARDISALVAAMTAAAIHPNAQKDSVLAVLKNIDPENYFQSRLVGRSSYRIYEGAVDIVNKSKNALLINLNYNQLPKPPNAPLDSVYLARMYRAFELLDTKQQDMPFHAGEIHLQVLTALLFADFDFEKTMFFLVNYGRDNDTTSAIAGGILGAFWGYEKLPKIMKEKVIKVNKELLNNDLELMAHKLKNKIIAN